MSSISNRKISIFLSLYFGFIFSFFGQVITQTLVYTGSTQTFVLPSCATSVTIEARGAQGGSSAFSGANGGIVSGVITPTASTVLYVNVGGQGSTPTGGFNGGGNGGTSSGGTGAGGGGATDIRLGGTGLTNRIMVAGGGGGSGFNTTYNPQPGAGGGGSIFSNSMGYGGAGGIGCASGGNGATAGGTAANYGSGGGGGGFTSGGSGGGQSSGFTTNGPLGCDGTFGLGGDGGSNSSLACGGNAGGVNGSGGGGGGYYGGGGGMSGNGGCNGGGGGGSSYANATYFSATSYTPGGQAGNGLVIISYTGTNTCVGEALNFNGGQNVQKTAFAFGSTWTAEAWIKPSVVNAGWYTVLAQDYWNNTQGFVMRIYSNYVGVESPSGLLLQTPITANVWSHIALTYNNGVCTFYKDGVAVGSQSVNINAASIPFHIGTRNGNIGSGTTDFYFGDIDEVRIWSTARTACQIQTFMNAEIPTSATGLLANYHFNQGVSFGSNGAVTSLTDASGNSNTQTLSGFGLSGSSTNWIYPGAIVSGYSITSTPTGSLSVSGNGNSITNGATSTSTLNLTNFGYYGSNTFSVTNTGSGSLTISNIILSGTNPNHFSVSINPSNVLGSGSSDDFTIVYTNTVYASTSSAVVNIYSSDCTTPTFSFVITASMVANTNSVGYVYTFAGSGSASSTNGTGTLSAFNLASKVVMDANGNLFVSEFGGQNIRKITPNGAVTTFAGNGTGGANDATGTAATFNNPDGLCFDGSGNLYVADYGNNKIRKITPAGVVTTFAGSGSVGSADGTGTSASFNHPTSIAYDGVGNFYVADHLNNKIRKITSAGVVTTFAGSGAASSIDGTGTSASFNVPEEIIVDSQGQIYVSDQSGNTIRKISPSGLVTTFAGSGTAASVDGFRTAASFNFPNGMCFDATGNLYVADGNGKKIRKITPNGLVSTIAGTGISGSADGITTSATFLGPLGLCFDANGSLVIGTHTENKIRKIDFTGDALNFDGTNDQVVVGTNSALDVMNNPFTMEAWVYPTLAKNNTILSKGDGNGLANNGDYIFQLDNTNHVSLYMGGLNSWKYSTGTVSLNQWNHVAAVYTGSLVNFYINGVLSTYSNVATNTANATGFNFYIGRQGQGCNCNFFQGSLDEVRVWNTARSQCQIQSFMNCEIPSTASGLVANYHFNQGVPSCTNTGVTAVTDATGSNNGTATNFALTGNTSNWVSPGAITSNYSVSSSPVASITVSGNGNVITQGSTSTSTTNFTQFGTNTSRTFSISNTGAGTLNIGAVSLSGTNASSFSVTTLPSTAITTGSTGFVIVLTSSNTAGTYSAIVSILNNDCTNGTFSFVVSASLTSGEALNFDAVNDYISVPITTLVPTGNSPYTIEAKIKANAFGTYGIIGWGAFGGTNSTNAFRLNAGGMLINYWWSNDLIVSAPTLTDGAWHHVAASWDGTVRKIYVDGVVAGQDYPGANAVVSNANMRIGCTAAALNEYFNGGIDEVRVWNIARSACEIQSYKDCEIPTSASGLVLNYHFNQGISSAINPTVTSLIDASGNNVNGTLNNFALGGATSNWISPGGVASNFTTVVAPTASISLTGNGNTISQGATSTSTLNNTNFLTAITKTFVITNSGTGTLNINNPYFTGTGASQFSISVLPASSLSASASTSFVVIFTPTTNGTQSAVVNIGNNDCTKSNFNFVIQGIAPSGEALSFDGVNDLAGGTVLSNTTANITLQAKVYWAGNNGSNQMIMYNGNSASSGYGLYCQSSGNVSVLFGGINYFPFNYTLSPNVWTSLSAVINSSSIEFYVNGQLTNTVSIGGPAAPSGSFNIGCNIFAFEIFNGKIDEVLFWNKALSQCEIQTYLNCEIPSSASNLLGNYHFNQGAAGLNNATVTSLTDASGNNNHLTLTNFALSGTNSNWVNGGAVVSGFTTTSPPTSSIALSGNGNNIPQSTTTGTNNFTDFGGNALRTFVVQNSGTGTLSINNYTLTGANASQFSVVSSPIGPLTASATRSFSVLFTPTAVGTSTALMSIQSNDCNNPTYTFVIGGTISSPNNVCVSSAINFNANSNPYSIKTADFNGDGKLDLAVSNANSNNVSIHMGSGTGTFAAGVNYNVGSYPTGLIVGDFNSDGKSDIAVPNAVTNNVSILMGSASGTFASAVNYAAGSNPEQAVTVDLNGDGKLDLAIANYNSSNVSVLMGSASGTFASAVNYGVGGGPLSITSGDFNGDGKADLATANGSGNNVSILLGSASGTFASAVNYTAGSTPYGICASDFNGDGKIDLAVANNGSSNVSILAGLGTGSFGIVTNFSVSNSVASICFADFNADGKTDLAAASASGNNITVLTGAGTGAFTNQSNYSVGTQPRNIVAGDFNNDGKPDIATANYGANNVSVLLSSPSLSVTLTPTSICAGNTATISVVGANTYTWSNASNSSTITVSPGSNTSYTVSGTNTLGCTGSATANVIVTPATALLVKGNGNAVPVGVSTTTLNFTDFGSNSSRTFSLNNSGGGTITISSLSITGANASQFSITASPASTITTGSTGLSILFTPTALGTQTAIVNIFSNDCVNPTYSFVISASSSTASALNFDGVNDYVVSPNLIGSITGTNNITIETWFKPNGAGVVINEFGSPSVTSGWHLALIEVVGSGTVMARTYNNTAITLGTVSLGTWNHVAIRYNHTTGITDGLLNGIVSSTFSSGSRTPPGSFGWGQYYAFGATDGNNMGSGAYFNGQIDEVRIWNTVRSQCQIQQFMNAEITSTASGLVANYHFNQGIPSGSNTAVSTLTDAAGSNHCTLLNMALTGSVSNWVSPGGVVNGFTTNVAPAANFSITGNGNNIPLGATVSSTLNNTNFGTNTVRTYSIYNAGSGTLNINAIYFTGTNASQFSVTTNPSSTITNGGTTFDITITPTIPGISTATVNIPSNDCTNPTFSFVITASTSPATALSFDGSNDNISGISGISLSNQAFSVEFWAKRNGTSNGLVLAQGNIATNQGLQVGYYTTNVLFGFYSNDMMVPYTNDGNWHHWAYVYDANATGTNRFVYQDGILIGSDHANGNYTGTGNILIGDAIWGSNAFNGSVDELRIWNTARTQCDVQTYMNAEITSTASGLIANYHFNQGLPSGSNTGINTLVDAAGTFSGTLNNFALTGSVSNWVSPGGVSPGFTTTTLPTASITLQSNGNTILNGSTTSNTLNNTSFGLLCVGGNTVSKTYSITNSGSVTLYVNAINLSGSSNFSVGTFPSSVAAASSATFPITFTIGTAGVSNATINLRNNDCNIPNYNFVISATVNALPTVSVTASATQVCLNNSITLSGSGANTYTWTGGISNAVAFSPTISGTYTVTGTNTLSGCTNTSSQNIIVNALPTISIAGSNTVCSLAPITLTASGASTYSWSSGGTGSVITFSPASNTTYTVTGTDLNACQSTSIKTISTFANPTVAVNSGSICVGQVFTLTPSGANTYTYSSGSNTVNPITNTNYSVTGTSTAGCVSSNTAVSSVTVNAVPTIAVNSGSICQGSTFVIVPSGASTYTVSGGSFSVSPLVNSVYSVSGTSSAGCISTVSAISNLTVNVTPTIAVNSGTICNGSSFSIIPTGGSTYTITGASFNVSPNTTSSYSVTGSSVFGCLSSNTAISTVSVFANPTVAVNSGSICVGQVFTLTPSGANTYTYSSGSNTVNPITNTNYSVTGTSTAGCVSSNTAVSNVTVNAVPTIAVNSGSICQGSTFVIVPSGASTYTVSGGSFSVSPLVNSVYSVSGTSSAGCISTLSAISNLTVNVTPTLAVNSGTICATKIFTIVPSGANTYSITGGNFTVSPASNTSYTVTGTSLAGCLNSNVAVSNVSVFANPTVAVNSGSICVGQVFTLTPSGANTYTYSSGSNTVNPITNTNYSVTGTSTAGCVSTNTAVSNVTVNTVPTIAVNSGSICQGSTFVIVPSGASTYTVSGGSFSVSPLVNSVYSVSGTSSAGCISTVSAISNLTVNVTPTITVNSGSICSTNSFSIIPAGANTYTISGGSFNVSPVVNTTYSVTGSSAFGCISSNTALSTVTVFTRPSITVNSGSICTGQIFTMIPGGASTYTYSSGSNTVNPITNTSYSVTGTSTAGCLSINTVVANVTVNAVPSLSINSGTICTGQSITLTPGGASTYTITGNNFTVNPLTTTNYSVSGTSSAGCTSTAFAVSLVSVNITPTVSVNSGSICQGSNFTITPSGASSYTISGNNFTVNPISTTSYSISGTSTNGCVSTASAISNVTVAPTPTITVNSGSICSGASFVMNPSGAVSYTYSSGSATVIPIANSSYSVTGTSALGCVSLTQAISTVTVYATPILTVNNGTICQGSSFTINPSGANTYTITGNSFTVSPLFNTNYTVSGTSTAGCTNTSVGICNLSVNASPTISVNSGTICETQVFTINPTGANTYTITGGSFTVSPINPVNTYSISGTNTNGCISNTSAISNVSVYINPTITASSGSICAGQSFTINPSGAISYTYSSGSSVITPSLTNSYSVSGTNTFGCVSLSPAILSVTVNANPTITVNSGSICNGQSFTINPSGASTYTISGNSNVVSPSVTTAYTVNGTSAQGCNNLTVAISQVTVFALPNVIANTTNSVVCNGQSITLSGAGANSYTWTNNVIDGTSFTPSATTTYSVIGKDLNGCLNNAIVSVTVNALPSLSVVSTNSSSCIGETLTINASGANTYSWSNGATSASIQIAPVASIVYTLVGTDLNNCSSINIFTQTVINCNSGISMITYSNHVSCRGKDNAFISLQPQLTYTNNQIRYIWNPSNLCPAENCADMRDLKQGIYQVTVMVTSTVTPTYVRKDTLQYSFNILDENAPCDINIFHGITANGDGVNDVFEVENLQLESYKNNSVKIYNRWGQLITEISGYNNTNKAWPSKEELVKLESSTYFYVIDLGDGSKPLKGWIELIKN